MPNNSCQYLRKTKPRNSRPNVCNNEEQCINQCRRETPRTVRLQKKYLNARQRERHHEATAKTNHPKPLRKRNDPRDRHRRSTRYTDVKQKSEDLILDADDVIVFTFQHEAACLTKRTYGDLVPPCLDRQISGVEDAEHPKDEDPPHTMMPNTLRD